jgi:hypothetical protein
VHQDDLALLQPGAADERKVHGQVVQGQRCALVERHRVREREHHVRTDRDRLGQAAQHRHGGHPVAGPEPAGVRPNHPGHLPSRRERQLGTQLVLAAGLQDIGEHDPRVRHVDDHLIRLGRRLGYLLDLHRVRAGQGGDHGCTH